MIKKLKKIVSVVIIIFLILTFSFNIYNFISIKILKHDMASINGYTVLEVVSGSMQPTLNVGDLIVINTKENNYKENDIVTFYDVNDTFVTHRIVEINDKTMITKGDNNKSLDEATKTDKIIGKYVFRIKGIGNFLNALKNPIVSIMILVVGIMICYFLSENKNGKPIYSDEEDEDFKKFIEEKREKENANKKEINLINKIKNLYEKKLKNKKYHDNNNKNSKNKNSNKVNKSSKTLKNIKDSKNKKPIENKTNNKKSQSNKTTKTVKKTNTSKTSKQKKK